MSSLKLLNGEWPGKVFELDEDKIVIGKEAGCDIILPDKHVSKKHACIVRHLDGHYIEDLKSTNTTKVNGVRLAAPHLLVDRDTIKICKYKFAYAGSDTGTTGTRILKTIDLTVGSKQAFSQQRAEEKLGVITKIAGELVGLLDLSALLAKVLDEIFRIFPQAERGFVLFRDERTDTLDVRASKYRHSEPERSMPSRTVYDYVIGQAHAVLCEDVATSAFKKSRSIGHSQINSIICAPLQDAGRRPVGILQVDTRDRENRFKQKDLDFLVAAAGTISLAVESARLHDIEIRHQKMEQESREAWTVQSSFLPNNGPIIKGYEFFHEYQPARFVGGDYFDYLPIHDQAKPRPRPSPKQWAIALGDVSGKGMAAALFMARVATEVRLLFQINPEPGRVMEILNQSLYGDGMLVRFVTFLLASLDVQRHRLSIINAGHMGPLIRRASGDVEVVGEERSSPPLGILNQQTFEAVNTPIRSGDVVVLYTDGVTDALDSGGKPFGIARLKACLAQSDGGAVLVGQAIRDAVRTHTGDRDRFDDLTFICLGRL